MNSEEKIYTFEEMDVIVKKHIREEAEILRKNLREKRESYDVEYV